MKLTREEHAIIGKIKKRNKTAWQIVDSRASEIKSLLAIIRRLSQ
jgi:hypothetical protein